MAHIETRQSGEEIFQGKVFRVTVDQALLENGKIARREVVHHNGGACVIALNDQREIYMVKQFRYPFGEELWELPAGKLEPNEDPFEAAKRELEEEAGVTAQNYVELGVVYPTVGFCTEKIYIWAATGIVLSHQHLDEDEFLSVYKVPLEKAVEMVLSGEIRDSKTMVGILKLNELIRQGKVRF